MQIEVLPYVGSPLIPYLEDKLVIIVDVLCFTSTVVTALANGAQTIIPVLTKEEAMEMRLSWPGSLLGGGGCCRPHDEGFDFSVFPNEYAPEKVGGKSIIMTTNGTRAIRAAEVVPHIWMASFLNMESVILAIRRQFAQEDLSGIVVFCVGIGERFDLADTLCAGMLIEELGMEQDHDHDVINDLGIAARLLYNTSASGIENMVRISNHGRCLIQTGNERDISYCCTQNILPIVPAVKNGEIVWLT